MKKLLASLLLLYVLALHSSMAAMEIVSTLILVLVAVDQFRHPQLAIFKRNRKLNWWLGAIVIAVVLSLLNTPQEKSFMFQFGFMRWTVLLWGMTFALQSVWDADFEKRLLAIWLFAVCIAGGYAVLQCLTGVDFVRQGVIVPMGGGVFRATGFFSLSLTFAYMIGLSTFALSFPALKRLPKPLVCVAVFLGGLGMVATLARGAWLAGMAGILLYLLLNKRKWFLPGAAILGAFAWGLARWSSGFGEKIVQLAELHVDESSSIRLDIWRGYWHMFLDHPIFGIGLLEGDKLLPQYYARLHIVQPFVSHAHNNYLQWLAGTGIVGFICYMTVIGIFLLKAWRLRLTNPAWGWSLFLAQVFLHLGGLTEANFIAAITNHFLVFLWAILLVLEARSASPARMSVAY